ncbi:CHAT domain-containing protein [Nitrosospira multiformis]|nr:CHAT domain-containing protein [Nitrosospira multiformis]
MTILDEIPSTSSIRNSAALLLKSDNAAMQVMALNMLVTEHGFGLAARFAGDLARAAYTFAREVYAKQGQDGQLALFTVSAIASSGVHAYNLLGHYAETVEFAEEVVPELEALDDKANLPDVYAHQIEALLGLHRVDEACRLLEKAEARTEHSVHLQRLKNALNEIIQSATLLPPESAPATTMELEAFLGLDKLLREGEKVLTKSGEEMNEWKAHATLRGVGQIFLDHIHGPDPVRLKKAIQELLPLEVWARINGHTDVYNEALWELYLCHSRLCAWSAAADALQNLRLSVEKRRAGIRNPLERAGAGTKYPHLYPALCQMLQKAGRIHELLGAIEAAKGRAVADVMAQRADQVIDEAEFAEPAGRMSELMRQNNAHYLSFLVDEDMTLAVLVGKDAQLYPSGPIPLGKEQIRDTTPYVDPRSWGLPHPSDLTGPDVEDTSKVLAPLVSWLEPLFESGVIEDEDHLCYSPDAHLHQLPLAYVQFMGKPLVEKLSISRTHGARALSLILDKQPSRPASFVSVEVPGLQDLSEQAMLHSLHAAGVWLAEHLPGTIYRGERGTLQGVCRAQLAGRVVHFATHGTFPREGDPGPQNPFDHSGLALAGADGLPDVTQIARGRADEKLLTPARMLEARLDFSDSHVTLQACVVGLAREGIGGDALGLDWAIFQQGASSLLAAHWDVSAALSAQFFLQFYRAWLQQGKPRAAAWRETIAEMRNEGGALAEPYAWAAFSLSGDWR